MRVSDQRGAWAKRVFDLTFSTLGLLLLAPLLVTVSVAIKLSSPGPVFYRGERIGLKGKPFFILKFRSMVEEAESIGGSSTPVDDPRITGVGHFLRRWKLDELPQLINVWKGEMSIVGPRPQVAWAVERYRDEDRRLLWVRPGITDWASIRFRHEGDILKGSEDPDEAYFRLIEPEKIRLGLEYVDNHSFIEDMRIILATAKVLIGG